MAKVVVTKSKLDSLAQHINTKAGTTGAKTIAQMQASVDGISTKMSVTWHQCPELVQSYLDSVTYDPNDYASTRITEYMLPSITPTLETKSLYTHPNGITVNGKTHFNEMPNVETPYVYDDKVVTVKPLDRLRWIKGGGTLFNCRDLGGWACDGGTIKYGLLIRGNNNEENDRTALVTECGVRRELDLRGGDTDRSVSPLGSDIKYYRNPNYTWYSLLPADVWQKNLEYVFDAVKYNEPVYFHCSAGADRTGTLACILEALLGVSQSDIDKDYELTCFSTGTNTDSNARRRNENDWRGLISQITNLTTGTTFRDKVVNWVASLGFTEDDINAFRRSMIDGTPEDINVVVPQYSITNNLTNVSNSNPSAVVNANTPYTATLTADAGYNISNVAITMGGTDITSQVYADGEINITAVSGDVVITAAAVKPIVNLFDADNAKLNMRWGSSSVAEKNGTFITNPIYAVPGDVIYLKNYYQNSGVYVESNASIQKLNAVSASGGKVYAQLFTGNVLKISGNVAYFTVPESWTKEYDHLEITLFANTDGTAITASDVSNVVIAKNNPIE